MITVLVIIAFVINNAIWMWFLFKFTPTATRFPVELPKVKITAKNKEEGGEEKSDDIEDLSGISLDEVAKSMGMKKVPPPK